MAERKQRKRMTKFGFYYRLYLIALAIAMVAIFFSVRSTLKKYEKSDPSKYVISLVEEAKKNSELGKFLETYAFSSSNKFATTKEQQDYFYQTAKSATLTAKMAKNYTSLAPVYNVYADGQPFITIALKSAGSEIRLGILAITDWDITSAILRAEGSSGNLILNDDGTFGCTIEAPEGFSVYVNDILLTSSEQTGEKTTIKELEYSEKYTTVPKMVTYELKNLCVEPVIKVLNNGGEEVKVNKSLTANVYDAEVSFASTKEVETMAKDTDPLDFAVKYSKLMTNDLSGANHGVAQVLAYMVPNSYLYNQTKKFSQSVDITFVSGHKIDSWTEQWVKNYVKYSDTCFSCDVHAVKNMTITRSGVPVGTRSDVYYNRVYFVYLTKGVSKAGWYVADAQALTETTSAN